MRSSTVESGRKRRTVLSWQSQAVLLALVPFPATWAVLASGHAWEAGSAVWWQAAAVSIPFALLVFWLRSATAGGAATGGIFAAVFYLASPGRQTTLWPLLALLVLTLGATKFGRRRKEEQGTAEGRRGRTASQVAANLGVAAVVSLPQVALWMAGSRFAAEGTMLVAVAAAMAEATADTLSSEIGQVLVGVPRLVTTGRVVAAGTDGGVTLLGTLVGCAGAALVVAVGVAATPLTRSGALIAGGAGVVGLWVDSLLGAVAERPGWLNNDAVNALSTAAAAALAVCAWRWL